MMQEPIWFPVPRMNSAVWDSGGGICARLRASQGGSVAAAGRHELQIPGGLPSERQQTLNAR